jgi:hypothetical protein
VLDVTHPSLLRGLVVGPYLELSLLKNHLEAVEGVRTEPATIEARSGKKRSEDQKIASVI